MELARLRAENARLRMVRRLSEILYAWLALVSITAWYLSFQHELTHGHPTRSASINRIFGLLPIALWYPFDDYKEQHLTHHQDQFLTQPGLDPESNYFHPQPSLPKWKLFVWKSQRTVAGRLLLGPGLSIYHLLCRVLLPLRERNSAAIWMWAQHLVLVAAVLFLAQHYAGIKVWQYATASYFGLGLNMLRSLYEHRPAEQSSHRIVMSEAAWRDILGKVARLHGWRFGIRQAATE